MTKKNLTILCSVLLANFSLLADTITVSTSANKSTVLNNPTTYAANNTSVFTYYGFPTTNYPTAGSGTLSTIGLGGTNNGNLAKFPPVQVSFNLTGTNFEALIDSYDYAHSQWSLAYFTVSDGTTTTSYTNVPGMGPGAAPYYVSISFASNITHHVVLSVKGNFAGVNVAAGNTVSAYALPKPNLLIVEGDSYTEGYNPTVSVYGYQSFWFDGWVWQLAHLVPNTLCVPSGIGGTGFISSNGGSSPTYGQRVVSDICTLYTNALASGKYNQIFITASGTINDLGVDTNALSTAAMNVYTILKNSCPQAHLFCVGNWLGAGGRTSPGITDYAGDTVLSNVAYNLNIPYYSPIQANVRNAGNYSIFFPAGTDSVHPGAVGYGIMAQWLSTNLTGTFGTNWDASSQQGGGTVYYTLTVNNGSGSGSYPAGQLISITASNIVGSYFTNWSGATIASPNQQLTTVTMPAGNLVVTANLVKIPSSSSLNVTNYGAIGDAVRFVVQTTSNSPMVSVIGTNVFTSADIGKVIEVFRAGPWLHISNNIAYGIAVTNQDTICLITNVTDGTNLWGSIPQGWTTNAYCIVGTNNAAAFQAAINAAEASVGPTNQNVILNIPAGTYLMIGAKALNPNYVMESIADNDAALTITSGGISLVGESPANTILMGCGAGMAHRLWNGGDPANNWPYGTSGAFVPVRGTIFYCYGPITNSQYPLVFQNLTIDGGLTNGLQNYNYWILYLGNGDGWDTTHDALLDINPDPTRPQMHQLKVFTNCVFQHWRGEMLKCVTGPGGTNTFIDIANCTFFDGNASANNLYYGQHTHGCTFSQLVKVQEYYQGNSTLPSVFENNVWTNIVSSPFSIVGSLAAVNPPSFILRNNVMAGMASVNQISFAPAENVTVISNTFYGPSSGIVFTSAGLQPSDGSASVVSNIVIACNVFNDTAAPITMDGIPVTTVLVTNNTSGVGNTAFASAAAGWKTNIVFANNTANGWLDSRSVQAGSYFTDQPNNSFGTFLFENGAYSVTNGIGYGTGRKHNFTSVSANSVFYLDDTQPKLLPVGAQMNIVNSGIMGAKIYTTAKMTGTPMILPSGQNINYYWVNGIWQTNLVSIKLSPPSGMRVILQ